MAAAAVPDSAPDAPAPAYNDPYLPLQRAFVETGAARAHRSSTGRDVAVAIIDTGADLAHPDLLGRVAVHRDLVGQDEASFGADRHGTEVAGVIAAVANNGQGIVGIAPGARLALYKACWYPAVPGGAAAAPARCNSFTLAKALAAVLESDARIVNLSLGGPADPLLDLLVQQLLRQRRIVVAALPSSGRREGFPTAVQGVIVVGTSGQAPQPGVLGAPGRDVLTLVPGGRYDFASGSSIAAAHASGVAALLLAAGAVADGPAMESLLSAGALGDKAQQINAEAALAQLARRSRLAAAP
jgi:subtilisin family serine protease